jgi:taurine dioxygenase
VVVDKLEQALQLDRLTGSIGAVVTGLDLAADLTSSTIAAIDRALQDHAVLFFVDQHLDSVSHKRFGRRFGELDVHMAGRNVADHPEVYELRGYSGDIVWHSDATFLDCPPRASVLRSVTLPRVGGDTLWSSTGAAFDGLSSAMQRMALELHALHDSSPLSRRDPDLPVVSARHPVVIAQPSSGRPSLFVNRMFTRRIDELTERESTQILELLFREIERSAHQVRWRWEPNSVAMWDNFGAQHCVVVDYGEQPRTMHRVTVLGPRPLAPAAI